MPRHIATGIIIAQAISRGIRQFKVREDKIWSNLYPDKGTRWIVRGAIVAGEVIGNSIRDSDNPEMDAQIPFYGPKADSQNQTRGRYSGKRGYYSKRKRFNCRCGRSSNRYRKSSRNR